MTSIFDKRPAFGWPRGQRFQLTQAGSDAESNYRETMTAARSVPGRAAFDTARAEWSARLGLDPSDGACLGELTAGARTLPQIAEGLESSGATLEEVRAGLTRLAAKRLIEAVTPPPERAPARRW